MILLSGYQQLVQAGAKFGLPISGEDDEGFCFIHFSDTHIDPRPPGQDFSKDARSIKTLNWLARCSAESIVQEPYAIEAGLPAFAIHTGDVMEYGPVGYAWHDFEQALDAITCPVSLVAGNHDNTWGEINHLLRRTYGNDSYSFDFGGCHFICLNSSGFLDPLPAWDRRTLSWLRSDLATVPMEVPLFLAMHHPLSGNSGYASEFDKLRLWKTLVGRRVALIMDGHWHTVHCQQWQGIDRVNGGATFGEHTGYNTVTLQDGRLRVMFCYEQKSAKRPQLIPLLEKPLDEIPHLENYSMQVQQEISLGEKLLVDLWALPSGARQEIRIDDHINEARRLSTTTDTQSIALDTSQLCPGWHYISTRVQKENSDSLTTAESFKLLPEASGPFRVYDLNVGAGVKTRPVVQANRILIANTSGQVFCLTRQLEIVWTYQTESQVVHSLSASEDRVLVGDIDGIVHCLNQSTGKLLWKATAPNPLYAPVAISEGKVFLTDCGGWLHSINLKEGEFSWSRKVSDYCFEAAPLIVNDQLITGCWDGFVYAITCTDGDTRWRTWSPKGHLNLKSRYYGAADCPPVVCGGSLFVCDRAWLLGKYSLHGDFQQILLENVTAIGTDQRGESLYAKKLDDHLIRLNSQGDSLWEAPVPTGRAPNSPIEVAGRVAVLSDTGILTLLDAKSGEQLWQYSLSPRLYCLSGIGTDGKETLVAADMDGMVTSIIFQ